MILLAAAGVTPTELLARAAQHLPSGWAITVQEHQCGAVLTVGSDVDECSGWMVVGRTAADPWGNSPERGGAALLGRELSTYGLAAMHLAAGPVVAFDRSTAVVARAPNGIVPVWVSGVVAGTVRNLVDACSDGQPRMLEPGHSVHLATGTRGPAHVCEIFDGPKLFSLSDVRRELVEKSRYGKPVAGPVNLDGALREGPMAGAWVYAPDVTKGSWRTDRRGALSHMRDRVLPELWTRARMSGHVLFAPISEAPAVELLSFVGDVE